MTGERMDDRLIFLARKPWLPLWATLFVLISLGSVSLWQWQALAQRDHQQRQQRFEVEALDISQRVVSRMQAYEMVLRGTSGLMAGSDHVSREEWERAIDQLQLQDRYPGIQGLAWARYVAHEQLETFLAAEHAAGRESFRVFPSGQREHYLLIDYISPLDWRNRRALGFDMLSEAVRRAAVDQAMDSGVATLSAPVTLLQETEENVQAGVLLYLPVYQPGRPLSTPEERRAAAPRVLPPPLLSPDFLEGVFG